MGSKATELPLDQRDELLDLLRTRFARNMKRYESFEWGKVQSKLEGDPERLWSLYEMERTGGEPDIIAFDNHAGEYAFLDCSAESPEGRSKEEVDTVISWLTGYDGQGSQAQLEKGVDLETFFAQAPQINPNADKMTGAICGVRVEEVADPHMALAGDAILIAIAAVSAYRNPMALIPKDSDLA